MPRTMARPRKRTAKQKHVLLYIEQVRTVAIHLIGFTKFERRLGDKDVSTQVGSLLRRGLIKRRHSLVRDQLSLRYVWADEATVMAAFDDSLYAKEKM